MKNLTIKNMIAACGGRYVGAGDLEREVSAVTTDSREVTEGCLFAAIAGERVDGHSFIAQSLAAGASCALAERMPENVEGGVILVKSTLTALQDIAAFYRRQFDIPVIGITGSVGKTTAKEMIASVLGQKYCVMKTQGNFNNDLGVPLTLFRLREEHTAAVVEMGISHFGEMSRLTEIVRPDYALFTVIGHAHLEFLGSREGVLKAKSEILECLSPEGKVFCNGDDDLLRTLRCPQKKLSFGMGGGCDVRALNVRSLPDGGTACTIEAGERKIDARISAFGEHMIYAALEGAAVGIELGLSDDEICCGIAEYEPVGHRARVIKTPKITIIDDCYNSNPSSCASGIRSLGKLEGRRVCILGDMLELGENSDRLHFDIGALAAERGAELVLTTGEASRHIADGAGKAGIHFDDKSELIASLPGLIRAGDNVLVKASRGMKFEDITEALKAL